jgi:hypothetical protein
MSSIDGLVGWYNGLDEVDRKNFWMGVAGAILIVIMLLSLSDTMSTLSSFFNRGAAYANSSVQGGAQQLNRIR